MAMSESEMVTKYDSKCLQPLNLLGSPPAGQAVGPARGYPAPLPDVAFTGGRPQAQGVLEGATLRDGALHHGGQARHVVRVDIGGDEIAVGGG